MRRLTLVLCAIPAGLAAGFLAWLAAGGARASISQLDPPAQLVAGLRDPRPTSIAVVAAPAGELVVPSLFVLTTGPGAVPQPTLRLDGLVRSGGRTAALLSVNDRPAEWMGVGETREGVTLQIVLGSKVVVDTAFGPRDVVLGERPVPPSTTPSAGPANLDPQAAIDQIPQGFRSPPPPASAPGPR